MRLSKIKKVCSFLLATVLMVSLFAQYSPELTKVSAAGTEEPTYDSAVHVSKYYAETLAVTKGSNALGGVITDKTESYYLSFNVKDTGTFYLNLRGLDNVKFAINSTTCYLFEKMAGVTATIASQAVDGGTGINGDGAKVTIYCQPDKVSVWVNGSNVMDAVELRTKTYTGTPQVNFAEAATLSNVRIWMMSDEPAYDANSDDLQYENASFAVDNTAFGFQSAADQTYYMSFDLNVTNTSSLYFNLRGTDDNGLRLVLQAAGKIFVQEKQGNVTNQAYTVADLFSNARITVCSEPDKVSVWVNHQKIIDAHALTADYQNLVGKPNAKYNTSATLSDVKIWTAKEVSDEPVYNSASDVLQSEIADLSMEAVSPFPGYFLCKEMPADTTYYTSFTVKTTGAFYLLFRGTGDDVRLILNSGSYSIDTGTGVKTTNYTTGLENGVRVTLCSTPTTVSLWLDGKKVVPDMAYEDVFQGKEGQPKVTWIDANATLTGVKTWTTKKNPDDWYNVKYFRSAGGNYQVPKKTNKVFAGWYTNDVFLDQTTALAQDQVDGEAYALFVDENVLKVGTQLTAGTTLTSDTTDLRLITTVDSLMYKKVGFNVTFSAAEDKNGNRESRTVYKTIKGKTEDASVTYMAESFSPESKYFMTYVFNNIPKDIFTTEIFTVTPYWVTLDGTKVTGKTSAFTISDLLNN